MTSQENRPQQTEDQQMQRFIGTKIIHAEPRAKNYYGPPEGHGQPGYTVVYPDGYTSWSPAAAFEEAYRPCDAMTFCLAIEALKKGLRVGRAGWNRGRLRKRKIKHVKPVVAVATA